MVIASGRNIIQRNGYGANFFSKATISQWNRLASDRSKLYIPTIWAIIEMIGVDIWNEWTKQRLEMTPDSVDTSLNDVSVMKCVHSENAIKWNKI